MDLEVIVLNEISQRRVDIIWYHLYVKSKINDTDQIIYKREIDSQT